MILKNVYDLENTPKIRKLISTNNTLETDEMRGSFYICRGFEVRTKSKLSIVFLHKVDKGCICFVSNGAYSLGEFHWFSETEMILIEQHISDKSKKTILSEWRQAWYYKKIIAEYVPIKKQTSQLAEKIESKKSKVERLLKEIESDNKIFNQLDKLNKTI